MVKQIGVSALSKSLAHHFGDERHSKESLDHLSLLVSNSVLSESSSCYNQSRDGGMQKQIRTARVGCYSKFKQF